MDESTLDVFFFFFQAEDGIRDYKVTGVQTCALPISIPHLCRTRLVQRGHNLSTIRAWPSVASEFLPAPTVCLPPRHPIERSEERRVGKECRSRWSPYH